MQHNSGDCDFLIPPPKAWLKCSLSGQKHLRRKLRLIYNKIMQLLELKQSHAIPLILLDSSCQTILFSDNLQIVLHVKEWHCLQYLRPLLLLLLRIHLKQTQWNDVVTYHWKQLQAGHHSQTFATSFKSSSKMPTSL